MNQLRLEKEPDFCFRIRILDEDPNPQCLGQVRDDICRVAEIHTGIPQSRLKQSVFIKKLIRLGWEKDLKELAIWVVDNQPFIL